MTTKVVIVNCGPMQVEVRTRSLTITPSDRPGGLDIYHQTDSEPTTVNPGDAYTGYYVHRHQSIFVTEKLPS